MRRGICRLCLNDADLCKSHIISECFYAPLYDEKHFFHVVSVDPERKPRLKPTGEYETLLCECCEQKLKIWEDYARDLVFGDRGHRGVRSGNLLTYENVDYHKLKLFQMSVLWRAGVSTRHHFRMVRLGRHEERLRSMLLAHEPGQFDEYGCMMTGFTLDGKALSDFIPAPTTTRIDSHLVYRFVFGAVGWLYFVSSPSHRVATEWSRYFVREDGTLRVPFGDVRGARRIMELFSDIAQTHPDWVRS